MDRRAPHDDWPEAVPAEVRGVLVGHGPRALGAISFGIVLLLFALAGWWAQDLLATVVNEGEADIGGEVSFVAEAGTYRVVTSGPLKPELERTICDVELANERRLRLLGGAGSVNPVETFGTARVVQFEARPGRTTVRCSDSVSPRHDGGRFQVVASSGLARYLLGGLAAAGVLAIAGGVATLLLLRRRQRPG